MTTAVAAVFRDGAFYPATPLDLPNGTAVRLTVEAASLALQAPDPAAVLARIMANAEKFNPATDRPEVTSRNVDEILYGGPDGVR